jgi:dTDP-4-dehydrorhamnose reductase
MDETILIIGASGLIGSSLFEHFSKKYSVVGTYNAHSFNKLIHLDLLNKDELEKILKNVKPEVILLPAALTNVDYCEKEKNECRKQNIIAPLTLINSIKNSSVKLVYYSTDYVFDGKNGPYSEEDNPHPLNEYGKSKLETEINIKQNLTKFLILRTTVVYGWEHLGKNFVYSLIKNLKSGQTIRVPKDQIGTPTYVENIAEATLELIKSDMHGIYNIAGPQLVDRHSLALIVAEVFDLNKSLILPIKTSELHQLAPRPLSAGLKINKLLKSIKVKMLSPREALQQMKQNPKENI